jgi:anion-transporting  ArsA/GET3 family ATPase
MACQYFVNGNWVTEEQFKEILNNGLLDNLIADSTVKLKNFKIDQSKVLSRETRKERRNTIPAAKLAKILAKEIKSRPGYAPNLLSALELTEDGQNFKIPLWASPYAAKFESLLTSLVTNKVIKQKFAGGSYVLGSEEGFRIKEGDAAAGELKNSGVVFTKNFDPKEGLQPLRVDPETGKMLPAQIMIPFKFRDESGKILPLEDFLVKQEGSGRYMLDTSKFPEKLLQLFGFRIPTQERNSMAAVEVVGFLPEASGDLILAPRDFTKQMGSDFDVDKLYTYMYNHFYDNKTGKLHTNFVSNAKKIENFINITKNAIEDIKSQFKFSKAERAIIDDYIKEVTVSLTDQDYADRRAKGEEVESQLSEAANRILNSSLNAELIKELNYNLDRLSILNRSYRAHRQNNILDVHLDIMTSNNPDVIASIIALDSFGEFEGLAADISKIRKAQGLISDPVTILSDSYQRDKFINATAGKNGVGAFSLDSTFNATAQGKDLIYINMNDDLYQKIINNNANPTEILLANNNPVTTFGDILSKGDLSNEYTLKSQQVIIKAKAEKRDLTKKEKESLKFKSSIIRALQSTSVDNEKAQILDKLNINDNTFDAIRALVQLGFEEKDIVGLITQEIVWEYVSNLKEAGSSLAGYTPDMEQKVYDKLVEKYDQQKRYEKLTPAQIEQFSSGSSEKLLENIANKKLQETAKETVTPDFNIEQLALLDKFRYLTEVGKDIKKTQSGINAFSKGLPKSLIEVQSKLKQISNLNISKIFNAGKLLGEINTEGILVSPTTLNGFASYYGTRFAGKIFDNYFPYSSQGFKSVAQEVQQHMPQGANMSVTRQAELQQEIFGNIKSFLYANSDTNLFGKDPDSERRRLFVDSKDNMSLATILSKLSSQEWFQKNSFLNKLSFDLNKNGKISRIMFESATGENFDERDIYGGFNYLLSKNFNIGNYNNIEYTSRMLAQELVAAAYLEGGTQGAAQYLKYVPIAYLKSLGFGEYLANSPFDFASTFFGNLSTGGPIYTMPSAFTRQYFQNNPSAAKTITMSDIEETSDKLEDRFKLTKEATKNNFVDIIDPATGDPTKTQTKFISIYAPKEVSKYVLYEFDEVAREYKKIPVLSDKYDFVAYNSERRFSTPIESGEIVTTTPPQLNLPGYGISNIPVEPSKEFNINVVNNPTKQDTGGTLSISKDLSGTKEALDDLFNALETAEGVSKLNAQLMVLLRTLQLPEGFTVEYKKLSDEVVAGYKYKEGEDFTKNKLIINSNKLDTISADELATAVNHELIHALTGRAIKLYEEGELSQLTENQIKVIERLKEVQQKYIEHLVSTEGEEGLQIFAKAYSEFKQFKKEGNWTNAEISKYYGAIKLSEFVTMALTDSKFQEHLNQIPGDNNRTLWEQIKDLLASLVNALGLDIKPGSALVVAIKDSLDLINVNQEIFKDQRVTNQPTQISNTQTQVKVVSEDYGVVQVETNPSEAAQQEFLNLIKPQIEAQTYKENVGKGANQMFHFGKMWSRVTAKAKPMKINSFAPTKARDILIDKGVDAKGNSMGISEYTYAYHELDQNGNPLPKMSELQPIIDEIQNALGIDMSDYDSVIGNIYQPNEFIYPHKDVTESKSAEGYPVIVYTMGANAGLGIVDNNKGKMTFANQYDAKYLRGDEALKGYTNEVKTKAGSIYTFGLGGNGRFQLTHSTPINDAKTGSQLPITLPNGKVITNYTITLTFRRAQDLEPNMPAQPAKLATQPTEVRTTSLEPGRYVKNNDTIYIVTKQNSNGTWQVLNPLAEGAQSKKSFSPNNLTALDSKANLVNYKGTDYLVTPKNTIISLKTNKQMNWGEENGDRKAILNLVSQGPTVIQEEIVDAKYELFPGVYANAGQREAIDLLNDFLQSDKQAFLLQGKGGTGKTTIIKKVLDSVREKESVLAIAPSHKAKKVLDRSINSDKKKKPVNTITLASALAIKLDESTGKFEPDIFARQKGRVPIKKASIILIDESSMVSDNLLQEIKQMMSPNAKIIFMGDRAQLPPVGQETDSKVFDIKTGYTLTEKMRQAATSPIINIGTKVSENVESGNPVIEPIAPSDRVNSTDPISGSSIKWESSVNNALQEFVEDFRKADGDVNFAKIVTFNNQNHPNPQSVKNLNEKVRARLYGENAATNQFLPGEMLTSYNSYSKDPQNPEVPPEFNNSEDLIVINSTLRKSTPITITVQSQEKGRRSKQFVFDVENLTLKNEDGKTLDNIPVIANSSKEAFKAAVSELYKTDRQMAYRLSAEFADIEYGYAITSHKAQGSTYTNVYVMEDNIMGPSNGGSTKAKNQSLYVAVSRPTTKLVMVSEKNSAQSQDFDAEGFYTGDTKENMSLQDWEDYNSINDLFDESITESVISRDKYENYLLICGK